MGEFKGEDKILVIRKDGSSKVVDPDPSLHFSDDLIKIEKWVHNKPISAIYFAPDKNRNFIKRFLIENVEEFFAWVNTEKLLEFLNKENTFKKDYFNNF